MATLADRWRQKLPIFAAQRDGEYSNGFGLANSIGFDPMAPMDPISPIDSMAPLESAPRLIPQNYPLDYPRKTDYQNFGVLSDENPETGPQLLTGNSPYSLDDSMRAQLFDELYNYGDQHCFINDNETTVDFGNGCSPRRLNDTIQVAHKCLFNASCNIGFLDHSLWYCVNGILVENESGLPKPFLCHTECEAPVPGQGVRIEPTTECNVPAKTIGYYHDNCVLELRCIDGFEPLEGLESPQRLNCSNSQWLSEYSVQPTPQLKCSEAKNECILPENNVEGIVKPTCLTQNHTVKSGCRAQIKCKAGTISSSEVPVEALCTDGNWTNAQTGGVFIPPVCAIGCEDIPKGDFRIAHWTDGECNSEMGQRPEGCTVELSCAEGTNPSLLFNQTLTCSNGSWLDESGQPADLLSCELPLAGCSLNSTTRMNITNEADCSSTADSVNDNCTLSFFCLDDPNKLVTRVCSNGSWLDEGRNPATEPQCRNACVKPPLRETQIATLCPENPDGTYPQDCHIQLKCLSGSEPDPGFVVSHNEQSLKCLDGKWVNGLNAEVEEFLSCHYPELTCFFDSRGDLEIIDQRGCNERVHQVDSGCQMNYSCPATPSTVEHFQCNNGSWFDSNDEPSLMGPQCPQSCPALNDLHGSRSRSTDCAAYPDGKYSDRCQAVLYCPLGWTPVPPFTGEQRIYCNRTHWADAETHQLDPEFLVCELDKGSCPVDTGNGMLVNSSENCNQTDGMVSSGCRLIYSCPTSLSTRFVRRCEEGKWFDGLNASAPTPSCPRMCQLPPTRGVSIHADSHCENPLNGTYGEGCVLQLNCLDGYQPTNSRYGSQSFSCNQGEWMTFRGDIPIILECSKNGTNSQQCEYNPATLHIQSATNCGNSQNRVDSGCQLTYNCLSQNPQTPIFSRCENGNWLDSSGKQTPNPCSQQVSQQCKIQSGLNVESNRSQCRPIGDQVAAECVVGIRCDANASPELWNCHNGQWVGQKNGQQLDILKCPQQMASGCEYRPTVGVDVRAETAQCSAQNNLYREGCSVLISCKTGFIPSGQSESIQRLICANHRWEDSAHRPVAAPLQCISAAPPPPNMLFAAAGRAGCQIVNPNDYIILTDKKECVPVGNHKIPNDCHLNIACKNAPNEIHYLLCEETHWTLAATGAIATMPVCAQSCESFWIEEFVDIRTLNEDECQRLPGGRPTAGCRIEVQCIPGHVKSPSYLGPYPQILQCNGKSWLDSENKTVDELVTCDESDSLAAYPLPMYPIV